MNMREFVEGCRTCDPRAEPDRAAELLKYAVQLGEAILKKREAACEKDNAENPLERSEQLLERSEKILDALIRLAENKTGPPKKASSKKASTSKPPRKKYGEYKHVLLTDEQYERLIKDFGETTVKQYIQAVDEYVQQKGETYQDYNLTIRKFIRRDNPEPMAVVNEHSYDLDLYVQHAMTHTPQIKKEV